MQDAAPFVDGADYLGEKARELVPNVKHALDAINARVAAQRAEALKHQIEFGSDKNDSARKAVFPQTSKWADRRRFDDTQWWAT